MKESERGSSPLTRGKRPRRRLFTSGLRLIPAHAGKTCKPPCSSRVTTAHPRSRGENLACGEAARGVHGSSPLTRGKRRHRRRRTSDTRLIPAHAGKTQRHPRGHHISRAHPRSRGENQGRETNPSGLGGSSPLTRGKLDHAGTAGGRHGLIPAHAGKTRAGTTTGRCSGAHPRSRGENPDSRLRGGFRFGSSPLTRGKLPHRERGEEGGRLIPAHAGKTPQSLPSP